MPGKFTLGKNERLKSRKAIEALFKNGKRFTVSPFRIFYALQKSGGLQFGAGVSTRNFKKAVDRNRIKRLTREAWRLQNEPIREQLKDKAAGLELFLIYTEKELPVYSHIHKQVGKIIKKLSATLDENPA